MPVEPIKIRCARCQQLLGVSPSKAGTSVDCPRCGAEVAVPERAGPDLDRPIAPPAPRIEPTSAEEAEASSDEEYALEILEIRPEDIRASGTPPAPDLEARTRRGAPPPPTTAPPKEPPPRPARLPATKPIPVAIGPPDDDEDDEPEDDKDEPIVPPIRVNESRPNPATPRTPPVRPSDLVVPRVVVTAWSLLVLLAVSFAFVAGLLAGHYVWRVH